MAKLEKKVVFNPPFPYVKKEHKVLRGIRKVCRVPLWPFRKVDKWLTKLLWKKSGF